MQTLINAIQIHQFRNGDTIVQEGSQSERFFIIKAGKVDVFKGSQKIRTITKNNYFGERSTVFDDVISASVVANGDAECWVIEKAAFLSIMDENLR
jgi:cGMP-dependent protein kinase